MDSKLTSLPHRFEDSCAVENKWAPTLDQWARESGYAIRIATADEQRRGIDRVMLDDEGEETTVDYKCDERVFFNRPTGNLFIETVSNATSQRQGWALTSEAVWLFYFAVPSHVLVFTFAQLRTALPTWRPQYPERAAPNERAGIRYDTLGICVPVEVAYDVAEYVARLDWNDRLILQESDQ